ncbi:MAG: phosphate signaling complex protein PhoU [Alphaproteobacteria bacterium]
MDTSQVDMDNNIDTRAGHIVKSFDDDLSHLKGQIREMGILVNQQLERVLEVLAKRDKELAQIVIDSDPEIDELEQEIDDFAVRIIALRQPVGRDLRRVVSSLKVSSHLERIADYATNIAKRTQTLPDITKVPGIGAIPRMIKTAQQMIIDVVEAYLSKDDEKAVEVWNRDVELDDMYMSFLREMLTYMMEDPRNITICTQLLFMAKNIERAGDHATNIAELVNYLVHGKNFEDARPKGKHEDIVSMGMD